MSKLKTTQTWRKGFGYRSGDQGRLLRQLGLGLIFAGGGLALTGCTSLPSDGPTPSDIETGAAPDKETKAKPFYQLVPITNRVVDALKQGELASSDSGLSSLAAPNQAPKVESLFRAKGMTDLAPPTGQTIASGDIVNVTIFVAGGGLFGPLVPGGTPSPGPGQSANSSGAGSTTLPPQVVDDTGQISVPYAGRVQVKGLVPYQVEQEIVTALKTKAIDPHAIVTVSGRQGGNLVTVTGDVKTPTMVPVTLTGTRLLDALTMAGGAMGESHENYVTVIRGGQARSQSLAEIFSDVTKNIELQPGDTVIVQQHPWTYLAFGASAKTGQVPFGTSDVSLAQAMAKVGGPSDARANPTVYLYRLESPQFMRQMGYPPLASSRTSGTPVIYQLDLRTPAGFFLAQRFSMRNNDVIYFPDAGSVGLVKFLDIVNALTTPVRNGAASASESAVY